MTYEETLTYLYESAPLFQQIGKSAYKEGLENTYRLDEHFGHPHRRYRCIHVAGTNGKGSCSHTLAAILQCAGYRVGLYTSPHLIDFRERIRVNGEPIPKARVIRFVEKERAFFEPLQPSFFELTTALAFAYFAETNVDIAVVETGLGGRLDCTNIVNPVLSIITNISFDHVQYLGDTLPEIAAEKAGIIKEGVPVVIGEALPETRPVFAQQAERRHAPIVFAEDENLIRSAVPNAHGGLVYETRHWDTLQGELGGFYQEKNTQTVLAALRVLDGRGIRLSEQAVRKGFAQVCELTGLRGRWQRLQQSPTVVCDTGHNLGGMRYLVNQLQTQTYDRLRMVFGMVSDKDVTGVLALLPREATYYFTQACVQRALPADELQRLAQDRGLQGECYFTVQQAFEAACRDASPEDFIFVGGSSFVVADLFRSFFDGISL